VATFNVTVIDNSQMMLYISWMEFVEAFHQITYFRKEKNLVSLVIPLQLINILTNEKFQTF
jgi:hypothetical protein